VGLYAVVFGNDIYVAKGDNIVLRDCKFPQSEGKFQKKEYRRYAFAIKTIIVSLVEHNQLT